MRQTFPFRKSPVVWCFLIAIVSLCAPSDALPVTREELQSALLEQLEYRPAELLGVGDHGVTAADADRAIAAVYHENGLEPLWVTADGPGERAKTIRSFVSGADKEGLDPQSYHLQPIEKYWESADAIGLARLDILLTMALARYVNDAREGRVNPRRIDPKLFATARDVEIDPFESARQALNARDLREFLPQQVPQQEHYRALRDALSTYRAIAAQGGWEPIPGGPTLKPGMSDERVPAVRKRLLITQDLKNEDFSSTLYDDELVEAVRHFQARHGLAADGVLGPATLAAMNVAIETLIRRIVMNMERWRWIAHDLGDTRVLVTIAGFGLAVTDHAKIQLTMPVIVGKLYHKTPVFSDMIKYIEFNPYWNIPPSIAQKEMLPKLKRDPQYLEERNIRLFSGWGPDAQELDSTKMDWGSVSGSEIARYKLRQDPGPDNALGTVKFMFPNPYNVYLHDTPSHNLFERTDRAFSHGCIRVSRPAELASYLLGGEEKGWGMDRVREVIASEKRTVVRLEKSIPVHIIYLTAWVSPDGAVQFRKDVYGRDTLLEKALF